MDKPQVDSIAGIPPAIAIDQTNPVRTSRSTVGTMTELNDHLKLIFARAAALYCQCCGKPVRRDTSESIYADLAARAHDAGDPRLLRTFPVPLPTDFTEAEVAVVQSPAVRGMRSLVPRAESQPVLVQLAGGRLRELPRIRTDHRDRLRPGHSG